MGVEVREGFDAAADPRLQTMPGLTLVFPSNPIYKVRWGEAVAGSPQEALEFSKRFDDPHNPRKGFAAIMVCSEADASCPGVPGAAVKISMPFPDPKLYDDTELESRKYAERRDEIGRVMSAVMQQARRRLASAGKL